MFLLPIYPFVSEMACIKRKQICMLLNDDQKNLLIFFSCKLQVKLQISLPEEILLFVELMLLFFILNLRWRMLKDKFSKPGA